jgi:hypothetical protein
MLRLSLLPMATQTLQANYMIFSTVLRERPDSHIDSEV